MKRTVKRLAAWLLTFILVFNCAPVDTLADVVTAREDAIVVDTSKGTQIVDELFTSEVTSEDGVSVVITSGDKILPKNSYVQFTDLSQEKVSVPASAKKSVKKAPAKMAKAPDSTETRPEEETIELGRFALSVMDANGNEWQLEENETVDVNVKLNIPLSNTDADSLALIHDPEGAAEAVPAVFSTTSDGLIDGISFTADSFTSYAIMGTVIIYTTYLDQEGNTWEITVEIPEEAHIPSGAELAIQEVYDDTIVAEAAEAIGTEVENLNYVKLLDISIKKDGIELQPDVPVHVAITLKDADEEQLSNPQVVHFGVDTEILDVTTEGNVVSFETEGFSVYAVIDGNNGEDARLTVNFWGVSSTEPVATYYVKNSDILLGNGVKDPTKLYLEDIVTDPGVGGTLSSGKLFKGWSIDAADANNDGDYDTEHYGASFNANTKSYTVDDIRAYLSNVSIKEGDVLNIYGMIFNVYTVTYEGPDGKVTLAAEDVIFNQNETSGSYTISQSYSAPDMIHNFEGWNVKEGASHISNAKYEGEDAVAPYQQGTTMDISGDVVLSVNMSEGHWLIFEENLKGATYNAPIFIKQTEKSRAPALEMKRTGYTFVGWYKLKDTVSIDSVQKDSDGNYIISDKYFEEYEFNEELTDTTTVYAKWDVAETAKYTVIVWKQSVADDKNATDAEKTYDFAFSVQGEANALSATSAVDLSAYQNKDGERINVDGTYYSFAGFKYNTTQTAEEDDGYKTIGNGIVANSEIIEANGTTVINLYYDRELVTYKFYVFNQTGYERNNDSSAESGVTYYGRFNNNGAPSNNGANYYAIWYSSNNNNWRYDTDLKRVKSGQNTYYRYYRNGGNSVEYTGDRYTASGTWNELTSYQMTGLYGQKLSKYNYSYPTDYRWFTATNNNTFVSIKDMFESTINNGSSDIYISNFYGKTENYTTNVYHYLQNVDDSWPTSANYTIPTAIGNGMTFRSFQGFTASAFRIRLPNTVNTYSTGTSYNGDNLVNPVNHTTSYGGWTDWLPYGTGVEYEGNNFHETYVWGATSGGIEFRYTRNKYDLTYMVGRFVNRNNEVLDPPITGTLKTVEDITYDSSMTSYATGGENYYNPDTDVNDNYLQTGYVFAGWYIDETCTTPAAFDGTMPLNGMTVYGKWQQVEYRVFLHPNAAPGGERDTTLEWGSDSQATNFRISYGDKVSVPEGLRAKYEFIGWYTDPNFTNPYNANTRLTDDTVPANPAYDKTVDMTDNANGTDMDKWGLLVDEGINKDVNRYWITRKLDLYAKWSAIIDGAEGIGVEYDTNGGGTAPSDTRLYKDNVSAVAQNATTPPSNDEVFLYWVLQDYDDAKGEYVDIEGSVIYPGENFTVLLDNAKQVARMNDDGTPMIINGRQQYTYTVRLRAQYGPKEIPTPTYINWYKNDGVATSPIHSDDNLQINEATAIYTTDAGENIPTREGYKFLGWAREKEYNLDADGKPTGDAITDYPNLTEANLFLKYDETNKKYQAKNAAGTWVDVTQVFADEKSPYHGMYAVWEKQKYSVTVVKVVSSSIAADQNVEFNFTPSFPSGLGTDVTTSFKLKGASGSNTKTFTDGISTTETKIIPYESIFRITETALSGFELESVTGKYTDDAGKEHTIEDITNGGNIKVLGDTVITFTNKRSIADLTVSKKIVVQTGFTADADKSFSISVTLSELPSGWSQENVTVDGKKLTFQLKDGGSIVLKDLPVGATYTLSEESVAGYTPSYAPNSSTAITDDSSKNKAVVTNTYSATSTTASFPVKKVLSVPTGLTGPESWSYTINVAAQNSAPEATTMIGTVSNTNDTASFGPFTYTAPGTYTYKITETGTIAGVTNDSNASDGKTVTVTVVDNKNGTLTATADSTTNSPLVFNNEYNVSSITVSIPVIKRLNVSPEGVTAPDITGKFTFTLSGAGTDTPMPSGNGNIITNPTSAGGSASFGSITFTTPGTYNYTVTEAGSVLGVKNDSSKNAVIVVTDKGDGTMEYTINGSATGNVTFTNTYREAEVYLRKIVSGNMGDRSATFTFKISYTDYKGETVEYTETRTHNDMAKKINGHFPVGATVTIEEIDSKGYDWTKTTVEESKTDGNNGTEEQKKVTFVVHESGNTVTFENYKFVTVDTGVPEASKPYILIFSMAMIGVAAIVFAGYKRRRYFLKK